MKKQIAGLLTMVAAFARKVTERPLPRRRLCALLLLGMALAMAGCCTPWAMGWVEECLPRHVEKCRPDTAFFVEKTEKRVKAALEEALKRRGFELAAKPEESDVLVKTSVDSWEFNDAGFTGFWARDDMNLTVTIVDRRKKTVLGRWRVTVKSDFRIIDRCVGKF